MFRPRQIPIYDSNSWFSKPVSVYFRVFGLFPFVVSSKENGKEAVIKWRPVWAIQQIALAIIIITLSFLSYYNMKDLELQLGVIRFIEFLTVRFTIIAWYAIIIFGMIVMPLRVKTFINYVKVITEVDTFLKLTYSCSQKRTSILRGLTIFILSTIPLYINYAAIPEFFSKFWLLLVFSLPAYCSGIATAFIAYTVGELITNLNERLKQFNQTLKDKLVTLMQVEDMSKCSIGIIVPANISLRNPTHKVIPTEELHLVYLKLSEAGRRLNDFIDETVMMIITIGFAHFVPVIFWLLTNTDDTDFSNASKVFTMGSAFARVLVVIEPSYQVILQTNLTTQYLSHLMAINFPKCYQKSIRRFGFATKLCAIRISACRFFEINRLIFTSMFGTIISYLVLLLQLNARQNS